MVLGDPRFSELRVEDFEKLSQELVTKVRCYGYVFLNYSITSSLLINPGSALCWRSLRYGMRLKVYFTPSRTLRGNYDGILKDLMAQGDASRVGSIVRSFHEFHASGHTLLPQYIFRGLKA